MSIETYIGRTVEIIYLDQKGRISQRKISIHSVREGRVRAYCLTTRKPRVFRKENILAVMPVNSHAV